MTFSELVSNGLDFIFIFIFFYLIYVNLPLHRMVGVFKGIIFVIVLWFLAKTFHFELSSTILGEIVKYGFLAIVILFPKEIKKMLESIGRRRIFSWNINGLISPTSRRELAETIADMSRKKIGGIFVIAREATLDEEIDSGVYIGEMSIQKEYLELLFHPESKVRDGAVIIKDDEVISARCRLPVIEHETLENAGAGSRHLAGLGVTYKHDCVAIVVSETTGDISFMGRKDGKVGLDFAIPLKENDPVDGISEDDIITIIENYLRGGNGKDNKPKPKAKQKPVKKAKN